VDSPQIRALGEELYKIANQIYRSKGNFFKIVHNAEMDVLAAAILGKCDAVVIDERTTRLLVENPDELHNMLRENAHCKVFIDQACLNKFSNWTKNIKVIRSVELALVAYEAGILDKYLLDPKMESKKMLVESILWGIKLHGCSVSRAEIEQLTKIEIPDDNSLKVPSSSDGEKQKI
jgi:hypothetical protein